MLKEPGGILAENVLSFLIGKNKRAGHAVEGGSGCYNRVESVEILDQGRVVLISGIDASKPRTAWTTDIVSLTFTVVSSIVVK